MDSLTLKFFFLALASLVLLQEATCTTSKFTEISKLSEVQDSGDDYPKDLPLVSAPNAFSGSNALFVLGHGAEDHEIFYQHQYLIDRGLTGIDFGCPLENRAFPKVVINDFFKPSYSIDCLELESLSLSKYDIIIIVGGLPSSAAVRESAIFMRNMFDFWNSPANKDKVLAVICSGSETLISSGIYAALPKYSKVTGSPASYWSWARYLDTLGLPRELFVGSSDEAQSIIFKSDGAHSHLVVGRNPNASPFFVRDIGNVFKNLNEGVPEKGKGIPLKLVDGKYSHPQLTVLDGNTYLPDLYPPSENLKLPVVNDLSGKKIALVSGSAPDFTQISNILKSLPNVDIEIACPGWVIQWKQATVFAMTEPPSSVKAAVHCDIGTDKAKNSSYDAVIIAGGLFSTNGVLRNDGDTIELIKNQKGPLVLIGTGAELLLPSGILSYVGVPKEDGINEDYTHSGFLPLNVDVMTHLTSNNRRVILASRFGINDALREMVQALNERAEVGFLRK